MAQRGSYGLSPQLDIQQLQVEAQHRWLRPAEICEILRNYQKFQLTPEPPTRPPSGSLFLFDKKALRYFRKDGHNWRKKKDGKTVKEAHEKLKVGSIDVLHCYYAHSEENESFQRRSYWMLETELMHIVFVHYLEVKGNRTSVSGIRENDEVTTSFQRESPLSYSYSASRCTTPSGNADSTSPTSTLTALCEDADSASVGVSAAENSGFHSFPGIGSTRNVVESLPSNTYLPGVFPDNHEAQSSRPQSNIVSNTNLDGFSDGPRSPSLVSWEEIFKQATSGSSTVSFNQPTQSMQPASSGVVLERDNSMLGELLGESAITEPLGSSPPAQLNWQVTLEDNTLRMPGWPIDEAVDLDLAYNMDNRILEQIKDDSRTRTASEYQESHQGAQNNLSWQYPANPLQNRSADVEHQFIANSNSEKDAQAEGEINHAFTARRLLSDGNESLKKVDSFNRWVSKELGDVEDLQMQSTPGITWSTVECENVVDESSLSPSISQDQLFSIDDFSPKWAYPDSEIEVLIIGRFLSNQKDIAACNWSCMFGELEVPTKVLAEGILSCCAPFHDIGRVPFYVTCSNRLACSEVREFDYRAGSAKVVNATDIYHADTSALHLHLQLERLLSFSSIKNSGLSLEDLMEKRKLIDRIIALKDEEETFPVVDLTSEDNFMCRGTKEELLQKAMKEKLYAWLLHKLTEDGKGPCILDEQGQGLLHLTAALGYDWAMKPILAAGISVNFRDVNGWTGLHWAACCGREQTVAVLVFLGADPGLVSDPSPDFPLGRTPADLASANGHKGISGFLAESTLTSYVASLSMNDAKEDSVSEVMGTKAFHTISERSETPFTDGDVPDALSLKASLTAVCNATHAASKIYQMFRIQSFQRKQLEHENHKSDLLDEQTIALAVGKARRVGLSDGRAHTAAIQIQKKFRGWRKRKEFLIIRQRIVKIQAHVRGHQVRKQYRTIIWSVGILEKIILRWRRKGSGLRGYRADASKDPSQQALPQKEDDYDFLKEGRKQTEERLQKALTRVKSMAQYPEARAQYRRLLTVVEGIQENKGRHMVMNSSQEAVDADEDLIDIESLLDDDAFMSMTFD